MRQREHCELLYLCDLSSALRAINNREEWPDFIVPAREKERKLLWLDGWGPTGRVRLG